MLALLEAQAHLRIELPELTIDLGQQRFVVLPPQTDDVLEGIEASLPRDQLLPQVLQVQVVLQRRLEVVGGHQGHQVEGLRRLGQAAQANDPVLVLPDLLPYQRLQELALPDAPDRGIHLVELVAEGLHGPPVQDGRAAVHVQPAVGIGQGQHGFLDGGIGGFALRQDAPGNQRPLELLCGDVGPPRAKQRLVGEGSLEANPVQGALRRPELGLIRTAACRGPGSTCRGSRGWPDHGPSPVRPCPAAGWLPAAGRPAAARCRGCTSRNPSGPSESCSRRSTSTASDGRPIAM